MRNLFVILVLSLLLVGCREDFLLDGDNEIKNLNFISEISPDKPVEAFLAPNIAIGHNSEQLDPNDAVVYFSGTDFPGHRTAMVYNNNTRRFILRTTDFRPKPGSTYEIEAQFPDTDYDVITSKTTIPKAIGIEHVDILDVVDIRVGIDKKEYYITVALSLETPQQYPAYVHIVPYHKHSTYRISDGKTMISTDNESSIMTIDNIEENRQAIKTLSHKEGVVVDYSRLPDRRIIFTCKTKTPLKSSTEIIKFLDFQIETMSEELYLYHQSLSRQLNSQRSDYSSPVSGYSNVERGYGVFGSSSGMTVTIEINH